MAQRKTDKQIVIRLDAGLKEDLSLLADDKDRSVNSIVLELITKEVKAFRKEYRERDLTLEIPLTQSK